jgi:hypothetical protein
MKKEKLSLGNIKNALSRAELRNIMAGSSGSGGGGGGGGCPNLGLAIPCCQCWTSPGNYVCITNTPPIPYECSCYCQSRGYAGGYNDCPINC